MERECHHIRDEYFRHKHGSDIVFYMQRTDDIFIVTIVHNRMDISNIFGASDNG